MSGGITLNPDSQPDKRRRRVVFVSHCLLDQNARFPGIAVAPGALDPLTGELARAGIGIEQLPCLEMKYWGGVRRHLVIPFLRHAPRLLARGWTPTLTLALRAATRLYALLCTGEARLVAHKVRSLDRSGVHVVAFILMNDSPTCGMDMTLDLGRFMTAAAEPGNAVTDWSDPPHDLMVRLINGLLEPGSGYFGAALQKAIGTVPAAPKFIGYEPWTDPEAESERILREIMQ